MTKCTISGCRNLATICKDCGREVCTKTFKAPDEWMSVEHRLPNLNEPILVYGLRIHTEEKDIYKATRYLVETNVGQEEQYWETEFCYDIVNVTHWMPLPKPPEKND